MMRKKAIIALVILMILSLGLFAISCSDEGNGLDPGTTAKIELTGFELEDEISVKQGDSVKIKIPLVLNEADEALKVVYEVLNSKNEYVGTNGDSFIASDPFGYTIRYIVISGEDIVATKTVKVTVLGSAIEVFAEYENTANVGEEITINATYPEGATVSYEVTFGDDNEQVTVTDGKFTPTKLGKYVVSIIAEKDGLKGYYSYEITVRNRILPGEVERFDESWTSRQENSTITRAGWKQVSSNDTSLKFGGNEGEKLLDRFGEEADFLAYEATRIDENLDARDKYIWLSLDIVNDLSYYKQLIKEGYEYISVWVYVDGVKKHNNYIYGDPANTSGYSLYGINGTALSETKNENSILYPNQWTELKVGLYPGALGRDELKTSLTTSYWNWKANNDFLYIDNSNENIAQVAGEVDADYGVDQVGMTVYIADIYAMRKSSEGVVNLAKGQSFDADKTLNPGGTVYTGASYTYKVYENGSLVNGSLGVGQHDLQVKVLRNGEFEELRYVNVGVVDTRQTMLLSQMTTDEQKVKAVSWGENKISQLSLETPAGKSEQYYKVSYDALGSGNHNYAPGIKINPTLSKAAIEEYSGGYVYFEVYAGDDYSYLRYLIYDPNGDDSKGRISQVKENGWMAVYIPVDDLIDQYDNLVEQYYNNTHVGVFLRLAKADTSAAGYFYASKFLLVKSLNPISISEDERIFDSSLSKNVSYAVNNKTLTDGGVPTASLANLEYYLDGQKLTDATATLNNIAENDSHDYSVYINHNDLGFKQLVYSRQINVIDSTKPYDFGSTLSVSHAASTTVNKVTLDEAGHQGEYFELKAWDNPKTEPIENWAVYSGAKFKSSISLERLLAYEEGYLYIDYKVDVSDVENFPACLDGLASVPRVDFLCMGAYKPSGEFDSGNTSYKHTFTNATAAFNEWHTIKIPMSLIIETYTDENVINGINSASGHIGRLISITHFDNLEGAKIYLGNVTVRLARANETGIDAGATWEWTE